MSSSTIRNSSFVGLPVVSLMIVCLSSALTVQLTKPHALVANPKAMHLKPIAASALSRQPFSFEENRGQTDARVKFIARSPGAMVFISPAEMTFRLDPAARDPHGALPRELYERRTKPAKGGLTPTGSAVRMRLVGANPRAEISGLEPLASRSNYFIGNNPAKWHTGIRSFRKVKVRSVYPGIDLIYYGDRGNLEYDLIVAPHADPSQVRVNFEGAQHIERLSNGDVALTTASGPVTLRKAIVYQERDGKRREIESRYEIGHGSIGGSDVAIKLASYSPDLPVVIDPTATFSTYLGGSLSDQLNDVTTDTLGAAIYAAGQSSSTDFPTASGGVQRSLAGSSDAVVVKISADGSSLQQSTYLGGTAFDAAFSIKLDSDNNVYVGGETFSTNFPVTDGSKINLNGSSGHSDGFITKINPGFTTILASKYVGGSGNDQVNGMVLDTLGNGFAVGTTNSLDFPVTAGAAQTQLNQGKSSTASDGFVYKFTLPNILISSASFVGGSGNDTGNAIALDQATETLYLAFSTFSPDFPHTSGGFQSTLPGSQAGAIASLSGDLSTFVAATYFGGTKTNNSFGFADTAINSIAINRSGQGLAGSQPLVVFGGSSNESDLPTTSNAVEKTSPNGGTEDSADFAEIAENLNFLPYSTWYQGSGSSTANGAAADQVSGFLFAVGSSTSKNLQAVNPIQPPKGGSIWFNDFTAQSPSFQIGDHVVASDNFLAAALAFGNNIYVGGSGLELATSPLGPFLPVGDLPSGSQINSVAVNPTNPNNTFVSGFGISPSGTSPFLEVSTDGGAHFTPVPNITDFGSSPFWNLVKVDASGVTYVTDDGKLFKQNSAGHWLQQGPSNMDHVNDYALDPNNANNIAVLDSVVGLFVATDGNTYAQKLSNITNFTAADFGAESILYLGNGAPVSNGMNPLVISPDLGNTVNNSGLPTDTIVQRIAASPVRVNGNAPVIAFVQLQPVTLGSIRAYTSTDGGTTFTLDPNLFLPTFGGGSTSGPSLFAAFSPSGDTALAVGGTNSDGTVTVFDPNGALILNSTFGGSDNDTFKGMTIVKKGVFAVVGQTASTDLTVDAIQSNLKGGVNGVVAEFTLQSPTPTSTPTATATSTASLTPTATATATVTATATATSTPTSTATPTSGGRISVSTKPIQLKGKPGHPKSKHLKVKNIGTGPLDVGSTGLTAPLSSSGGGTIAPKHSTTITVTDSPTMVGSTVTQTLKILSNDPMKPQVDIQVTGTGP